MSSIKKKARKLKLVKPVKFNKKCQELEASTSRTEYDYVKQVGSNTDNDTFLLNSTVKMENLTNIEENDNNACFADTQIIVHNVKKEIISINEEEKNCFEDIYIKKEIKEEPLDGQDFYERIITNAINKYKEINTNDELKNFVCSNCDKIFNQITVFQDHLEGMHGEDTVAVALEETDGVYFLVAKPNDVDIYHCNCKLIFNSKEEYDMHTVKCKKCFHCDICNESYPGKVPYDTHFLIYHRVSSHYEMPVEINRCDLCSRNYVGDISLHWCPMWTRSIGYYCKYCKEEFQTNEFLSVHKKAMAKPETQCNTCYMIIEQKCQLPHICDQSDMFQCKLCSKVLSTDAEFQEHILLKHIVDKVCQEVPTREKKSERKKSKKNVSKQKLSEVSETSELQIKHENIDISETNASQQNEIFQNNYNNCIETVSDYDKQRYDNLMRTLIKDVPSEQDDDIEIHLDNHIITVVSNNMKEEIESTEQCDAATSITEDIDKNAKRNKRIKVSNDCIRIYKCAKCKFYGKHKEYAEHKIICKHKYINKGNTAQIVKCKKCNLLFTSTYDFVSHYVREGSVPLQCLDCDEVLDNRITYELHVYGHMFSTRDSKGKLTLKCNLCNCSLRRTDYHKHWVKHLNLDSVNCETVNQIVTVVKERRWKRRMASPEKLTDDEIKMICDFLATPKRKLLKEKMKSCCYCNKDFNRIHNTKVHMIEHLLTDAYLMKQQRKALICQFCLKPLQTADSFKQHVTSHAFMKRHHCEHCSKTFSDSSNFSKHKKTHNPMVLICDLCAKRFTSKKMLIRHFAEEHADDQRLVCRYCSKEYKCLPNYKKHVRMVHENNPRYTCRQCKQRFNCLKDKWNHMWQEHGERTVEADCSACDIKFRTYQKLKSHILNIHSDWPQDKREKFLKLVKASKRKLT